VVTVALIGGAALLHYGRSVQQDEFAEARLAQRLQPVGSVYAGETGAAALAAAQEAAREAAKGQVAFDGTLDGATIYNGLCSACHGSGAGGAPKLEQAAWSARIAQGVDVLVKHAIDGYQGTAGLMPARGGNASLTDEQVDATVKWMLDNIK
jgi:cytochrome c5